MDSYWWDELDHDFLDYLVASWAYEEWDSRISKSGLVQRVLRNKSRDIKR